MNFNKTIQKRIFLVGTARSGTTLLQSMLASHPDIYSLPETHFFRKTIPKRKWFRPLKRYGEKERNYVINFLKRISKQELASHIPTNTIGYQGWAMRLLLILDDLALSENKNIWVEKTPMHLYYIDLISRICQEVRFIHLLRQGEDVIASLYKVSHEYPDNFTRPQSIQRFINLWKKNYLISENYIGENNHVHILYEDIIADPEKTLMGMCRKLEISYNPAMLSYQKIANSLQFDEEKWKSNTANALRKSSNFNEIFSEKERTFIRKKLEKFKLDIFRT